MDQHLLVASSAFTSYIAIPTLFFTTLVFKPEIIIRMSGTESSEEQSANGQLISAVSGTIRTLEQSTEPKHHSLLCLLKPRDVRVSIRASVVMAGLEVHVGSDRVV